MVRVEIIFSWWVGSRRYHELNNSIIDRWWHQEEWLRQCRFVGLVLQAHKTSKLYRTREKGPVSSVIKSTCDCNINWIVASTKSKYWRLQHQKYNFRQRVDKYWLFLIFFFEIHHDEKKFVGYSDTLTHALGALYPKCSIWIQWIAGQLRLPEEPSMW